MSRRNKPYEKQTFESNCQHSDTSANIYESMLLSAAWFDLKASAQVLYLACKSQYYSEKHKPISDDKLCFTMNQGKWADKYKLYRKENAKAFYRDMASLIEHGFIDCVESGANTRTKSIYRFSDRWHSFGTKDFSVPPTVITSGMRKRNNRGA